MKLRHVLTAFLVTCLLLLCSQGQAQVTATGDGDPDFAGAQRNDVRCLLDNIVDPSASVARDYRMQVIITDDGRVISGLVEDESERTVTVVNATDRIVISRNEIESQTQSAVSIMPTGLLERLNDREIRDLIGYLQR